MTINDLNDSLVKLKKKTDFASVKYAIVLLSIVFSNFSLFTWLKETHPDYIWMSGVYLGFAFIYTFWFLHIIKKYRKLYLPKCPECNGTILPQAIPVVIATANCTMCGKEIIDKIF